MGGVENVKKSVTCNLYTFKAASNLCFSKLKNCNLKNKKV